MFQKTMTMSIKLEPTSANHLLPSEVFSFENLQEPLMALPLQVNTVRDLIVKENVWHTLKAGKWILSSLSKRAAFYREPVLNMRPLNEYNPQDSPVNPKGDVKVKYADKIYTTSHRSRTSLQGKNWLNDEVIDVALSIFMEVNGLTGDVILARNEAFDFEKRTNEMKKKRLVIWINHDKKHWRVIFLFPKVYMALFMDPMSTYSQEEMDRLTSKARRTVSDDPEAKWFIAQPVMTQGMQKDGHNCGVYSLVFSFIAAMYLSDVESAHQGRSLLARANTHLLSIPTKGKDLKEVRKAVMHMLTSPSRRPGIQGVPTEDTESLPDQDTELEDVDLSNLSIPSDFI